MPDLVGNLRTRTTVTAGTTEQTQFNYNVRDQLIDAVFSINGVTQYTTSYQYDANGSLVQESRPGETTTNGYDLRNRLTRATVERTEAGGTVTEQADYIYDANGLRTSRTVTRTEAGGTTTTETRYVLDKLSPYGHPRVIEERDASGVVQVGYAHGLQPIAEYRAEGDRWYMSDMHSGVRLLADSAGVVTYGYLYDAYGNLLSSTGTSPNNLLYRGEQFDPMIGAYYLRARYYDPATGRFTQMDPWSGDAGRSITLNKYLYGNADPVRYSDPTGPFGARETLTVISVGATRASIEVKGREMQEKQVDAAWLGRFFLDFMAINMYYTWHDEPLLRPQLVQVEPYIMLLSKDVMANSAKRYANMDTRKKLQTLGKYLTGFAVEAAVHEMLGDQYRKGNGEPAFAHIAGRVARNGKRAITVISLRGSRGKDYVKCNSKLGLGTQPYDHLRTVKPYGTTVWHHHEVIGIMLLVPSPPHPWPGKSGTFAHTGGVLLWEIATGKEYPKDLGPTR